MSGKPTEQVESGKGANKALGTALTTPVTGEQVAAYLRQNPGFLKDNPELLDAMTAPSKDHGEGVVDLQQAMIERLRGEIEKLRQDRDDVVVNARNNLSTATRVHKSVVALLAATSFEQFIERITTDLAAILDLDAAVLGVENTIDGQMNVAPGGIKRLPEGMVASIFGDQRQVALHSDISGDPEIFGHAASLVRSHALIRLRISSATPPALLAFGARTPDHFDSSQGTELLAFLGDSIELLTRAWLQLPE
jgi:uncharacterized protein YigA (DUF484 family)